MKTVGALRCVAIIGAVVALASSTNRGSSPMGTKRSKSKLGEGKPLPLFLAARGRRPRAEFPLYHTVRILSIRILHKLPAAFYPVFVQHYQLTFGAVCGILMMSRGETQ